MYISAREMHISAAGMYISRREIYFISYMKPLYLVGETSF